MVLGGVFFEKGAFLWVIFVGVCMGVWLCCRSAYHSTQQAEEQNVFLKLAGKKINFMLEVLHLQFKYGNHPLFAASGTVVVL